MSNLSDIGFPVTGEQDVNEMIMSVLKQSTEIPCPDGFYLKFSDESGAEIYLQGNKDQELIGFNPHFAGKSKRRVGLTRSILRESSDLDGGFHGWAEPTDEDVENSGKYQFVFDVPDFRINKEFGFPQIVEIQLTAFASTGFSIFASEAEFWGNSREMLATKSFVPSGLYAEEEDRTPIEPPRPFAIFTGEIKEFELKTNTLSGENFYWFLVETFGGEVDVVADANLVDSEPTIGGIVSGQFWLSGRLIN